MCVVWCWSSCRGPDLLAGQLARACVRACLSPSEPAPVRARAAHQFLQHDRTAAAHGPGDRASILTLAPQSGNPRPSSFVPSSSSLPPSLPSFLSLTPFLPPTVPRYTVLSSLVLFFLLFLFFSRPRVHTPTHSLVDRFAQKKFDTMLFKSLVTFLPLLCGSVAAQSSAAAAASGTPGT